MKRIARPKCYGYPVIDAQLTGKCGLEIGGPSQIFRRNELIPVYERCAKIDHCNFSSETIWNDARDIPKSDSRAGNHFIAEASNLSMIPPETYDFVLASHVLEHTANPMRALQEWKRVLKPEGTLLIVVPHKCGTFDRRRAFTSFEHIETDFRVNTPEDDLTHVGEILELHDLDYDPLAGDEEEFRERCLRNSSIRGLHHHVFSPDVVTLMFCTLGFRLLNVAIERPFHIIVFGQKADPVRREEVASHNQTFVSETTEWRQRDPFRSVRAAGTIPNDTAQGYRAMSSRHSAIRERPSCSTFVSRGLR